MKTTAATAGATPGATHKDSRHFFYYCPKLDLWALGRTKEEAEAKLREEIRLLLARCREYLDFPESLNGSADWTLEIRPS